MEAYTLGNNNHHRYIFYVDSIMSNSRQFLNGKHLVLIGWKITLFVLSLLNDTILCIIRMFFESLLGTQKSCVHSSIKTKV